MDSSIIISGYIMDSISRKGIGNAIISYEELPFGNYISIIKSMDEDGFYEFRTLGHKAYRIEIKARNYQNALHIIYPNKEHSNGYLKKDYMLKGIPADEVITLENLIFDLGKSEIKPDSFNELDNLAILMKGNSDMVIQLEGHTDFKGGKSKNLKLSQDRVKEVKNYLIHSGIMPDRILTKAYGGTRPLSHESTEEAARLNRRVEVRIIKR